MIPQHLLYYHIENPSAAQDRFANKLDEKALVFNIHSEEVFHRHSHMYLLVNL